MLIVTLFLDRRFQIYWVILPKLATYHECMVLKYMDLKVQSTRRKTKKKRYHFTLRNSWKKSNLETKWNLKNEESETKNEQLLIICV